MPFGRALMLVKSAAAWARVEVALALVREIHRVRRRPAEYQRRLDLACAICDYAEGPPGLQADLRSQIAALRANRLRLEGNLVEARTWLEVAEDLRAEGSGDAALEALVVEMSALLAYDQGMLPAARAMATEAERLWRAVEDLRAVARLAVHRVRVETAMGRHQEALDCAVEGLTLVQPQDGALALALLHNMAYALVESSQPERARWVLTRAEPLYRRFGGDWEALQRRWLVARLNSAEGRCLEAETQLTEVAQELASGGHDLEAALAVLELAAFALDRGDLAEALRRLQVARPALERHGSAYAAVCGELTDRLAKDLTGPFLRSVVRRLQRAPLGLAEAAI
ncbi:MAG TPA: hypothetical protein VF017_15325 [Thermoanaerobaculia bacterium]|nr:hypothetical protein [Thermoanaerobaculia bacterium]